MAAGQPIKHGGRFKDLTGQVLGRWTVLRYSHTSDGPRRVVFWLCRCECGTEAVVRSADLRRGHSLSCGCLKRDATVANFTTHGQAKASGWSPEYRAWCNMLSRCYNQNGTRWGRYGGRGITVCARWRESFEAFYADMGPRPSKEHSLDRIENDGNYEPGNVRWATRTQQMTNMSRNRLITIGSRTLCLADWAKERGVSIATVKTRMRRGMTIEKALGS